MRPWLGTAVAVAALALGAVVANGSEAASAAAPANTSEPRISGTPVVGRTLTATRGTWSGDPASFEFQWVRCPADGGRSDGGNCAAISGATTTSYVLGGGDAGRRIRVIVTALNADGSASAASNATAVVARPGAVTNTARPTISGTPVVGATLTASPGSWTGSNLSFAFTWRRCDADGAGCNTIAQATGRTYVVQPGDVGDTLRVRVVARNDDRSASATSLPTERIRTAGQPAANGCPTGSGPIPAASLSAPARLSIDRQTLAPTVVTRETNGVVARVHVSACGGRSVQGALVFVAAVPYNQFAGAEQPTDPDGWATVEMRRLRGFPASDVQQLLVLFLRARKAGESALTGVGTSRLVSFPVRLNG